MKIGALVFLTAESGNPGAIAREVENLGFESFFVAEHMALPSTYTTHYPRSRDGKVPEFYARLIDPFIYDIKSLDRSRISFAVKRGAIYATRDQECKQVATMPCRPFSMRIAAFQLL